MNKFRTKKNKPTKYAFICGHVESKTVFQDHLFTVKVEVYKEAACNVWQIRGFKYYNGSSVSDRLFWESIDTNMRDAINFFNKKCKELRTKPDSN